MCSAGLARAEAQATGFVRRVRLARADAHATGVVCCRRQARLTPDVRAKQSDKYCWYWPEVSTTALASEQESYEHIAVMFVQHHAMVFHR